MNDIKAYISFVKDRIKQSFLKNEKEALAKGLKLLRMSLDKLLTLSAEEFLKNQDLESMDTLPELNILALPQNPLIKKMETKFKNVTTEEEKILDDFSKVQLTLSFITFEYIRLEGLKQEAVTYAKWMLGVIGKLRSRIGEAPPQYVIEYENNMNREIYLLEIELTKEIAEQNENKMTDREIIIKALNLLKEGEGFFYLPDLFEKMQLPHSHQEHIVSLLAKNGLATSQNGYKWRMAATHLGRNIKPEMLQENGELNKTSVENSADGKISRPDFTEDCIPYFHKIDALINEFKSYDEYWVSTKNRTTFFYDTIYEDSFDGKDRVVLDQILSFGRQFGINVMDCCGAIKNSLRCPDLNSYLNNELAWVMNELPQEKQFYTKALHVYENHKELKGFFVVDEMLSLYKDQLDLVEKVLPAFVAQIKRTSQYSIENTTSVRTVKDEPATNIIKLKSVIGNQTIEAIFDPYFEDRALEVILSVVRMGIKISPTLKILTYRQHPTLVFWTAFKDELSLPKAEIRKTSKQHRRFFLLDSGQSIIIGNSLNQMGHNEAIYSDNDVEDKVLFNTEWAAAQPVL